MIYDKKKLQKPRKNMMMTQLKYLLNNDKKNYEKFDFETHRGNSQEPHKEDSYVQLRIMINDET